MIAALGTLAGLGFVSGVRLYAAVLVIGLGIRFGYLTVPPHLSALRVCADTPVLAIAGVAYVLEFLADKIPWIDTIWDAAHTFVRPIGAAVLAATAVGDVSPTMKLAAALLCGGVALSSHAAKAGTRVIVNHSPEPFSNLALSLGEDVTAVGGVWIAMMHPIVSLVLTALAVGVIVWFVPRLIRLLRGNPRT